MLESDFQKRVNQVSRDSFVNPEGQGERLFIGDDAHQLDATVAITQATGALAGVNTALLQLKKGDTLVVLGVPYTCVVAPTADNGTAGVVLPAPLITVAATEDAYIMKNTRRDDAIKYLESGFLRSESLTTQEFSAQVIGAFH